jgi:TolB-like protein
MITGRLPFRKGNVPATLHAILHEEPDSLQSLVPDLPPVVQSAVERAMKKEAIQRYQTVADFALELQGVLGNPDLSIPVATAAVPAETAAVPAAPQTRSLAVLHLRNLGAPDDDFLCYGITEDLIVDLTRVGSIRVLPMRNVIKYKDSDADLQEIGTQLGADLILDGSIMKSSQAVRVSAQLIQISTGDILWAERWEEQADALPKVKSALAEGISQRI